MKWHKTTLLLYVGIVVLLLTLTSCGGSASIGPPTSVPGATEPTVAPVSVAPTPTLTALEQAEQKYLHLRYGSSIFNPPKEMHVGVAETITYRVLYGTEVPQATLEAKLPTTGRQVLTETLRVASRMTAALVGDGDAFTIMPLHSSDEKALFPDVPNDWSWQVIPTRRGEHTLTIRVTAIIEVGQEKFRYDFPVTEKTVVVRVNWNLLVSGILNSLWTQLSVIAVVLSSVAVTLYQMMRRRHAASQVLAPALGRAHIEALIVTKTRRLRHQEEQQAFKGPDTPAEVVMEIEDLRRELTELERRLDERSGNGEEPS